MPWPELLAKWVRFDTKLWSRQLAVEPGVGQIPSNGDRHIHFQMSLRVQSVAMLLGSEYGWREEATWI